MPTRTCTIEVPGGRLHAVADGEGPPILLVHAGIADLRAWDALVPLLVDAGYRAIRYDCRGFGRSTTEDVDYSNRADLVAVLDAFDVGRAVLVGNSRGAIISLDTLVERPDRVAGLVWVGGGISGYDAPLRTDEEALFTRMEAIEEAGDPDAIADIDVAVWVDGFNQPAGRAPAAIREAVREMDRALYEPGRINGRPIPLDPPADERLGEIRVPVVAVLGGLDVPNIEHAAARLEAEVAGARTVVVPDVGHMAGMEAPERLAGIIAELARSIGSWG
ncbi:MAG TPA: alpha/beta hydrolase [Candidatus Limnocylindrales bacterium]|nr:alpha/beta hydrolase [Candidatus Limnocylindrales bacterium]